LNIEEGESSGDEEVSMNEMQDDDDEGEIQAPVENDSSEEEDHGEYDAEVASNQAPQNK